MNRRNFLSVIASAVGALAFQFKGREIFDAPKPQKLEWTQENFASHFSADCLPSRPGYRGELWLDNGTVRIAE